MSTTANEGTPLLHNAVPNLAADEHTTSAAAPPAPRPSRFAAFAKRWGLFGQGVKPSTSIVLPPLAFGLFGVGLSLLPRQNLFLYRACMEVGIDPMEDIAACRASPDASKIAVEWQTIIQLIGAGPALLSLPFLGVLVDRVGRKPFLIGGFASAMVQISMLLLIAWGAPIYTYFIAEPLFAIFGPQSISVAMFSYISDVSDPAKRASNFALTDALLIVSILAGPSVGGVLASYFKGLAFPFQISLACLTIAMTWILLFVPESLKRRRPLTEPGDVVSHSHSDSTQSQPFGDGTFWSLIFTVGGDLYKSIMLLTDGPLFVITLFHVLQNFIYSGTSSYMFYFLPFRFGWGEKEQGYYLLAGGFNRMFYLALVLPMLVAWFERGGGWIRDSEAPATATEASEASGTVAPKVPRETDTLLESGEGYSGAGAAATDGAEAGPSEGVPVSDEAPLPSVKSTRTVYERTVFEFRLIRVALILYGLGYSSFGFLTQGWQLYLDTITVKTHPGITFLLCGVVASINLCLLSTIDLRALANRITRIQREAALANNNTAGASSGPSTDSGATPASGAAQPPPSYAEVVPSTYHPHGVAPSAVDVHDGATVMASGAALEAAALTGAGFDEIVEAAVEEVEAAMESRKRA
ncbi:hypothetical protein HDU96_002200 [Phlyctochytrium bullatum]|nr:hypothetical protein HDU96_002200 [Phlyctochytrium bullatum]